MVRYIGLKGLAWGNRLGEFKWHDVFSFITEFNTVTLPGGHESIIADTIKELWCTYSTSTYSPTATWPHLGPCPSSHGPHKSHEACLAGVAVEYCYHYYWALVSLTAPVLWWSCSLHKTFTSPPHPSSTSWSLDRIHMSWHQPRSPHKSCTLGHAQAASWLITPPIALCQHTTCVMHSCRWMWVELCSSHVCSVPINSNASPYLCPSWRSSICNIKQACQHQCRLFRAPLLATFRWAAEQIQAWDQFIGGTNKICFACLFWV